MWNNRAMSNRYWISVAPSRWQPQLAGVYVARMVSQPAVPSLESGTSLPRPELLLGLQPARHAGRRTLTGAHAWTSDAGVLRLHALPRRVSHDARAARERAEAGRAIPGLKVALISVDPERDTPEQLGKYISSFGGDLIGLTGTAPEISKATKSFGVAASRVDLPGGNYTMDHSATVFVLDSDARIVAVFTPPFKAAALTRDIARLAPVLAETGS